MNGHLREGSLVLDTSTGDPGDAEAFARRLRSGGVAYLDATISGSSEQLRRGERSAWWAVTPRTTPQCGELFAALGGPVRHVGDSRATERK